MFHEVIEYFWIRFLGGFNDLKNKQVVMNALIKLLRTKWNALKDSQYQVLTISLW